METQRIGSTFLIWFLWYAGDATLGSNSDKKNLEMKNGDSKDWLNIFNMIYLVCWRRYLRLKQRQEKPKPEKMET